MGLRITSAHANKTVYAQEGLMDRIAYFFTSDHDVSEKIGNMLYCLNDLSEEQIKALEATHIDFKMQTYSNTQKLMVFSSQCVDFVAQNCRKYEGKSYALLEEDRDEIRQEIDSVVSSFLAQHDTKEIVRVMESGSEVEDKTYASLGFTYNNLITLAKEFKDHQSGRLNKLRKMKFIANCVAVEPNDMHLKVVHDASKGFVKILNLGIDVYKYVDKFLFYTYRKLDKQGLIKN